MHLSTKQSDLLLELAQANYGLQQVKLTARARERSAIHEEMQRYLRKRDTAVRIAYDAGVPISQIAEVGLQTTNRGSVRESLKRTEKSVDNPIQISHSSHMED